MKYICLFVVLLSFTFTFLVHGGKRGQGVRQRLAEDEDPHNNFEDEKQQPIKHNGGVRQRLSDITSDTRDDDSLAELRTKPSHQLPLFRSLRREWAKGELSARQVQDFALGAKAQGAIGMESLAGSGSGGTHSQNIHRSLMSLFGHAPGSPDLYWAEIPTTSKQKSAHPFFLPHEFFRSMFLHNKRAWERLGATPQGAYKFWKELRASSFVSHHPNLPEASWAHTLPIGMHGDGGAFSKQDSLYVISWNSLLAEGTTSSKRILFTVIRKTEMVDGTLDAIWKVFAWSMNTLLTGKTPCTDYLGRAIPGGEQNLAGGWQATLCQCRGDWEFYWQVFSFPRWNENKAMCFMCKASAVHDEWKWTACGDDAGWRNTRWTHETYLDHLRANNLIVPLLFILVIGFRLECVMIDVLHTVDLGTASHIIGNIMWECVVRKTLGGSTQQENIKLLNGDLNAFYKKSNTPHSRINRIQGKLTMDRLRTEGGWPKLKAKAAATRHAAAYALDLWIRISSGNDSDLMVLAVIERLVEFYSLIDFESMYMRASARCRLPVLGKELCTLYNVLACQAFAAHTKMWKTHPKLHLFLHLCEWQSIEWGNPKYWMCYADEDLVGILIDVAESCHPMTLNVTALLKWMILVFWEDDDV